MTTGPLPSLLKKGSRAGRGWSPVTVPSLVVYNGKDALVVESEIKRFFELGRIPINQLLWTKLLDDGAAFGTVAKGNRVASGEGPWAITLIYGTVCEEMRVVKRSE